MRRRLPRASFSHNSSCNRHGFCQSLRCADQLYRHEPAHQLAEICCETGGALKTAMGRPRMGAALRQILPALGDMVVDIFACIGLVVHQEGPSAKAKILIIGALPQVRR